MHIGKIKSAGPQTIIPSTLTNVIMSELVFEDPDGVVDANASGSTISVAEAGYYLVVYEAMVVGAGDQQLELSATGISEADSGIETMYFGGDALGVSYGKAVVLKCTAGAFFGLRAGNNGGGNVTYLCSIGVVKLSDL